MEDYKDYRVTYVTYVIDVIAKSPLEAAKEAEKIMNNMIYRPSLEVKEKNTNVTETIDLENESDDIALFNLSFKCPNCLYTWDETHDSEFLGECPNCGKKHIVHTTMEQ